VMQQHVGGAGRAGPEESADDAAGGLRALERVEFEPLVEQVARGLSREFRDPVALALTQARALAAELQQAGAVSFALTPVEVPGLVRAGARPG
jgi:hypothetical protein